MAYTYLIRHNPTRRVYYGVRTANTKPPLEDLWQEYFTSSKRIHELIAAYGADSFDVEIRKIFDSKAAAIAWEKRVLTRCKVMEDSRWINANIGGYILPTAESCAKISAFHKGVAKSDEHKQKISEANRGKKKGPLSVETRAKISAKKSGENNPMFGVPYTEERRLKQSDSMKGKPSPFKGKTVSEEQKQRQREKMLGRKIDPAVVEKRSATLRSMNMKRERLDCPHCSKNVPVNIYARYHGDRCKFNQ
jgi:hypothetical protein